MPKQKLSRQHQKSKITDESIALQLVEQAGDAIFSVDLKGNVTYANKAAQELLKLPLSKILHHHFTVFLAKDSLVKARRYFQRVRHQAQAVRDELNTVDGKGNVMRAEFTAFPVLTDGKVTHMHAIIRDVSRRKAMERLVQEAEKMKAIQFFITGTAQEIQYPLKGTCDRVERLIHEYEHKHFEYIGYKDFKQILKVLRTVGGQLRSCYETTQQLSDLTKAKNRLVVHHCSVNAIIKETARMLAQHLKTSGISVQLKLTADPTAIAVDAVEFGLVVHNILTNAIQAMPSGGKVIMKTSHAKNSPWLRIECRDSGVGIERDALPRVFEPFFTTKQARGLERIAGLGLSTVYFIVGQNKGTIEIKSNLREGTSVILQFPLHKSSKLSKS